jgi:fructose-specific phosphotransferase system IIC component
VLFAGVLSNLVGGVLAAAVILAVQAPFTVVNLLPGVVTALLLPFLSLLCAYAYFNGRALEQAKQPLPPEDLGAEAATSRG